MLDKFLTITGWRAAWLSRTLPLLQSYTHTLSRLLTLTICALGLYGFFSIRRLTKSLTTNPSDREAIFKQIEKKVTKVCRAHWFIGVVYLVHAMLIAFVDAYIGVFAIKSDVEANTADYDAEFWLAIAVYSLGLFVLFMATMFLVPLAQMLGLTWMLARFMRKRGVSSLSGYMTEARMYSTHLAQLWCMLCFFAMAWWKPSEQYGKTLIRWLVLEACFGSSMAWLDASYAFDFAFDRIADKDFKIGSGGVTEVVRMFADTVAAVHGGKGGEKEVLPVYEGVAVPTQANDVDDEKTPLTQVDEERQIGA